MRSRAEAMAAKRAQTEAPKEDNFPASWNEKPKTIVPDEAPRYPLENDMSAMYIALKESGHDVGKLTVVAEWKPADRHVVAMWLEGKTEDVPACLMTALAKVDLKSHPTEQRPGAVPPKYKGTVFDPEAPTSARTIEATPATAAAQAKLMASTFDEPRKKSESSITVNHTVNATAPETVSVTIGEERYDIPKTYSSFTVGAVFMSVHPLPGESYEQAFARARAIAIAEFDRERARKTADFLKHFSSFRAKVAP